MKSIFISYENLEKSFKTDYNIMFGNKTQFLLNYKKIMCGYYIYSCFHNNL